MIGCEWRSASSNLMTPEMVNSLTAVGWRYVQVRGRGGSYFERIPDKLAPAA
jgi:hypothetical protein